MEKSLLNTSIETSLCTLTIREDGILEMRFKFDEYEVDVDDSQEIQDAFCKLTNDGENPHSILVISGRYGGVTKRARELEAFGPMYRNVVAEAIVVHSISQRLLGRMFMQLKKDKPQFPYQFFKTEEEAHEWLKETEALSKTA